MVGREDRVKVVGCRVGGEEKERVKGLGFKVTCVSPPKLGFFFGVLR
jgi:hypothetical protein